ncbi:unnamed protein product [Brassica rapa]|uniref:Uncharacterized protein n=2 Tax=Brassica TaxID=3705 RepID=A0A8D9HV71_BRACM|nr:unnamed protein product [Brassica napus]CAG7906498.1 unnamed protein product [Brassica rapa]
MTNDNDCFPSSISLAITYQRICLHNTKSHYKKDTENIPTFMAPSPTVNIGSIHAPPTSVSTTVIQAMEALPISSVATLNSTSVSDGQVLASTPSSFVEILPTTTESEPSTPATMFKATVTDTPSNSALSENALLNTNHAATLGDFPVTGSVLLTPPPKVSNDIPPSTSGETCEKKQQEQLKHSISNRTKSGNEKSTDEE